MPSLLGRRESASVIPAVVSSRPFLINPRLGDLSRAATNPSSPPPPPLYASCVPVVIASELAASANLSALTDLSANLFAARAPLDGRPSSFLRLSRFLLVKVRSIKR
jgi:hypothetical protein